MTTTTSVTSTRNAPMWVTIALGVLAVLFVVVGVVYITTKAADLPGFFPGHVAKGAGEATKTHTKHALAAFIVGALALIGAWMSAGRRQPAAAT